MGIRKKIMGCVLTLAALLGTKVGTAQKSGMLPFNGVRYFYEGITAKKLM